MTSGNLSLLSTDTIFSQQLCYPDYCCDLLLIVVDSGVVRCCLLVYIYETPI